jgi:predicted transcriptional regulator
MRRHFSNYLSRREAEECCRAGIREVVITPTALRQTPKGNLELLREKGIKVILRETRGRPRKLHQSGVMRVLAMRQRGLSYYRIARLTGLPKSTVFDYCRRHAGMPLPEEEVSRQELIEAKSFLERLREAGISDELTSLAARGCAATSPRQIAYILGEIEKVMEAYR